MMRRIYIIILIMSILGTAILYSVRGYFTGQSIIWVMLFLSVIMVGSIHGIIAHSTNVERKGGLIIYPLIMGVIFGLILFIWVFVLIPGFDPDFIDNLRMSKP